MVGDRTDFIPPNMFDSFQSLEYFKALPYTEIQVYILDH